jgi:hypothetical protein
LFATLGWCHAAPAQEPVPAIHVAARIACRQWPVLEHIFRYAGAGDEEAANALFNKSVRRDGCIRFRAGDRVYISDRRHSWRQLRLRREGDPVEYWAVVLGGRLPHRLNQWAVVE